FVVPMLPLASLGMLAYWIVRTRRREEPSPDAAYYTLMCSVSSGLLASVIVVRPDVLHFIYLAPVWYVVLAWVLGARGVRNRLLLAARPFLCTYVGVAFGMLALAVLLTATGARNHINTARGRITTGASETVLRYLLADAARTKELFVYPYLPLYNYFTGTHNSSRYDFFQPGMHSARQGEEIIAALKATNDPPVLFEPWFPEKVPNSWARTSVRAVTNDPVSDYILRNYRVCRMLTSAEGWRFQYMVKSEAACP